MTGEIDLEIFRSISWSTSWSLRPCCPRTSLSPTGGALTFLSPTSLASTGGALTSLDLTSLSPTGGPAHVGSRSVGRHYYPLWVTVTNWSMGSTSSPRPHRRQLINGVVPGAPLDLTVVNGSTWLPQGVEPRPHVTFTTTPFLTSLSSTGECSTPTSRDVYQLVGL
ncbi:hypothetical protein BDV25DRAFT_135418 [Aspergillus avenaceus]|uniref:Uncharacterized protein n=1 Tax=Aspergillus avenaceus TaxID=36643 RepID=A0A5N6U859_ASPAV|nr:hypothetical protein BDV25DRAFT_135418 [Aspergillus avenaceus]